MYQGKMKRTELLFSSEVIWFSSSTSIGITVTLITVLGAQSLENTR